MIGFFVRDPDGRLPHPPIPLAVLLVVEEALRVSWSLMRNHPRAGFDIASDHEDVVTQELYEILVDKVFASGLVDGFDHRLFTTPTRESKLRNYNGRKLDKMPDLLIGLVGRAGVYKRSQDWIFIECKPIDSRHTLGKCYCNKGLIRFANGDYAWAMTAALMVGFVSEGYEPLSRFQRALDRSATIRTVHGPKLCARSTTVAAACPVHFSCHERSFAYEENGETAPPITVRHVWLSRA